jgi:hypothetical protein
MLGGSVRHILSLVFLLTFAAGPALKLCCLLPCIAGIVAVAETESCHGGSAGDRFAADDHCDELPESWQAVEVTRMRSGVVSAPVNAPASLTHQSALASQSFQASPSLSSLTSPPPQAAPFASALQLRI